MESDRAVSGCWMMNLAGTRAAAEKAANPAPLREHSHPWKAAALFGVLLVCGCAEPTTGVVAGTVNVDSTPVQTGSIAFFPVDGKSSTAGAEIIDGQYEATVPLGAAKVEIRVPKVIGERKLYDTPDSPVKQVMTESLPAKYNDATELTLDVKPGENRQDYDLKTK